SVTLVRRSFSCARASGTVGRLLGESCAQLVEDVFEPLKARLDLGQPIGSGWGLTRRVRPLLFAEQLCVAVLLLAGPPLEPDDELAAGEPVERFRDGIDRLK